MWVQIKKIGYLFKTVAVSRLVACLIDQEFEVNASLTLLPVVTNVLCPGLAFNVN